jgi:hypothetical protein
MSTDVFSDGIWCHDCDNFFPIYSGDWDLAKGDQVRRLAAENRRARWLGDHPDHPYWAWKKSGKASDPPEMPAMNQFESEDMSANFREACKKVERE